jgi:hypothetical protein
MILEPRRGDIILCHSFGVCLFFYLLYYNHDISSGFYVATIAPNEKPYKISPKGRERNSVDVICFSAVFYELMSSSNSMELLRIDNEQLNSIRSKPLPAGEGLGWG